MTKEEGLEFLRNHQPMPSDLDVDEETLIKWNEAREYFEANPCEEAIPLFLNSLCDGDGFETYGYLDGFLASFEPETLIPYFIDALKSPSPYVRSWAAELSYVVHSGRKDFIEALLSRLFDPYEDARSSAVSDLFFKAKERRYDWRAYENIFRKGFEQETADWIKEQYQEIFALE